MTGSAKPDPSSDGNRGGASSHRPASLMVGSVADLVGDPEVPELASGRAPVAELHRLLEIRLEHAVEVDQPLVLVSQIGRSGGTLLARLLDAHPELHVHPYELHIGHPDKSRWPELDPHGDPDELFQMLREPQTERLFWGGYYKQGLPLEGRDPPAEDVRPFCFLTTLQQRLFNHFLRRRYVVESSRDVLDCYMTALFNAWLDYGNLYRQPKRWVVGYAPTLGWGKGREGFVGDYPDGLLIGLLRDAESWWASARLYDADSYGDLDFAMELWRHSTRELISAKRERPDSTEIIAFSDLIRDTNKTMRRVSGLLGIRFDGCLLKPTFNGMPIPPNSSFAAERAGAVAAGPGNRAGELSEGEAARIRRATAKLFRQAEELAATPASG